MCYMRYMKWGWEAEWRHNDVKASTNSPWTRTSASHPLHPKHHYCNYGVSEGQRSNYLVPTSHSSGAARTIIVSEESLWANSQNPGNKGYDQSGTELITREPRGSSYPLNDSFLLRYPVARFNKERKSISGASNWPSESKRYKSSIFGIDLYIQTELYCWQILLRVLRLREEDSKKWVIGEVLLRK